ncbi:PucR family transcriptional regulator [Nocardia miyunensis]|uniref:PucR family transcriptional regulator n=1 Tax=Nocardia miyunensis TaxID=282684 RepID=UPI00083344D4|nr:helix-turn-helix domain-containing protein [Nocardia miyunensis]
MDPPEDAPGSLSWRLRLETTLVDRHIGSKVLSGLVNALSEGLDATVCLLGSTGALVKKCGPCEVSAPIPSLERLRKGAGVVGGGAPVVTSRVAGAPAGGEYAVGAVVDGNELFGWVVTPISGSLDPADIRWALERAVVHLRMEFVAQRRLARVAGNARANLVRHMVRSTTYDAELRTCAEYLGVDLEADRVIVFVLERGRPSDSAVDVRRLGAHVSEALNVDVIGVRGSEGVILTVAMPGGADAATFVGRCKDAVTRGLARVGDEFSVSGISSVARPGQLRRAYREAVESARCLDRYPSASARAITCHELGPARLLVANSDERSVRSFVNDVVGVLVSGGAANTELLRTLQAYFDSGRSVRETAVRLGIHENTVRHRLGRVHDLTGLDVAGDSNDQLTVQTALLILRLQGHHAIPGFDSDVIAPIRSGTPARTASTCRGGGRQGVVVDFSNRRADGGIDSLDVLRGDGI